MTQTEAKRIAAETALHHVSDGMVVGLGTGSTARFAIEALGVRVREGWRIIGVPTSQETESLAQAQGIPLGSLEDHPVVDVAIDGADEVDPTLNLIKGGGGALWREKLVAHAAKKFIVVVDESKLVSRLGRFPLPVEVHPFDWKNTADRLSNLGCEPSLRRRGRGPFRTDNGHYILDCAFGEIADPAVLEKRLNQVLGVIENGLFVDLVDQVIVGTEGGTRTLPVHSE